MKIYKATFFRNCAHKIEILQCIKLTPESVVMARLANDIENQHTRSDIILVRETSHWRYCEEKQEAVDFLIDKYEDKIVDLNQSTFEYKQKQKKLTEEMQ